MTATNTPLTKDERYENKRLSRRTRGLHSAEKQALEFIADAQTMQNGVCSRALTTGADTGVHVRTLQRGIHGRPRGKYGYPGLLARGIVYVTGGYPKGGLAPGGNGLTPAYAINRDRMMDFIPEVGDDSKPPQEKGDPKGDQWSYKFS